MTKMTTTRVPPQFGTTTPPPPAKPDGHITPATATSTATRMGDWVKADMAYKESQPLIVSDGGKGVSN
jgi:hypothetical protein